MIAINNTSDRAQHYLVAYDGPFMIGERDVSLDFAKFLFDGSATFETIGKVIASSSVPAYQKRIAKVVDATYKKITHMYRKGSDWR